MTHHNDETSLKDRANYTIKEYNGKKIYLFEDHRSIINILALKKKQWEWLISKFNIITLDSHTDNCNTQHKFKKQKLNKISKDIKKIYQFVEFDLHCRDDDWIQWWIELWLINNIFLFIEENSTDPSFTKNKSRIYNLGPIHNYPNNINTRSVGPRNLEETLINDLSTAIDNRESHIPLILDIDLDYFTDQYTNKSRINKRLRNRRNRENLTLLISNADFITIASEQGYNNGIEQTFKILKKLDQKFFWWSITSTIQRR